METLRENDFYSSTDLALAGALYASGYPLEALDRQDPSRVVFYFPRNKYLDDIVRLYLCHELKIDAQTYFYALKELKNRIYNY